MRDAVCEGLRDVQATTPVEFLKKDSDDKWVNTPGLAPAAFQLFKCIGQARKKEGRDVAYKAKQGMSAQSELMEEMEPWLQELMKATPEGQ